MNLIKRGHFNGMLYFYFDIFKTLSHFKRSGQVEHFPLENEVFTQRKRRWTIGKPYIVIFKDIPDALTYILLSRKISFCCSFVLTLPIFALK